MHMDKPKTGYKLRFMESANYPVKIYCLLLNWTA